MILWETNWLNYLPKYYIKIYFIWQDLFFPKFVRMCLFELGTTLCMNKFELSNWVLRNLSMKYGNDILISDTAIVEIKMQLSKMIKEGINKLYVLGMTLLKQVSTLEVYQKPFSILNRRNYITRTICVLSSG